jgi:hypothetical protein
MGRGQRRGGVGRAPERGDLILLNFTPQSGREQAGRRPALVVSPSGYNSKVGLVLVCPITSRIKGYPFEVPLQLRWTEGEARPNCSRDHGLPPGGDGAAHGLAQTA